MAVINYTVEQSTPDSIVVTWSNLANGDTGEPLKCLGYSSCNGQVSGTLGSGGAYNLGASYSINNPVYNLNSGSSLPSTTGYPVNTPALIRPAVVSGDGSTSITFTVVMSK